MPRAEVETVVPASGRAGSLTKVPEIAARTRRHVLVIAGSGVHPNDMPPPRTIERTAEILRRPIRIGNVAKGEHVAADRIEQFGGRFGVPAVDRDVTGAGEHRRTGGG